MQIEDRFIAPTPQDAFRMAIAKYGKNIKIRRARHIKTSEGRLYAEITIIANSQDFAHAHEIHSDHERYQKELQRLQDQIKQLQTQRYYFGSKIADEVAQRFSDIGIATKWLKKAIDSISMQQADVLYDAKKLATTILEQIDQHLDMLPENSQQGGIRMLVGPTGVGKTTTVAKIAARFAYGSKISHKVLLVNLDNYKVGAHEQLAQYARIMRMDYRRIQGVESFSKILQESNRYDLVLVDTAGISPYDTQKFIETVAFVDQAKTGKLQVDLVLPATVKYEDMQDIYENFSFLGVGALVVTKLDETRHYGSLLNFMLRYHLPMRYFSIGQNVPDDLIVANKEYLLQRFIGELDG